ncbi:hypothetical protein FOCC_FOCC011129 [Frankliniella occidentalis]|uniref:Serine-rich adhesin for platelets-like isoform X1 n=1 Tax=Frankliniella occidentalis TaxID=133901 RepID=A0A6J1SKY5_FRAOC|nr:serine-rich adhesin for platelets-like isoform X1 [Frankliniella occidentalis]KAE8743249.1 hypothetical protein FOCC_FOCC011129 [Frankliniella occidentalis]
MCEETTEKQMSLDNVSSSDSNDMLWETMKMDLDQNRAYQNEQVQTLKGQTVRLPVLAVDHKKVRKVGRNYRLHLKHIAKKKAFKLAVKTLRTLLTTKSKKKRKSRPYHTDYISTMNFKVFRDENTTVNEKHLEKEVPPNDSALKDHGVNNRVDQSVQAGGPIMEDKVSQTVDNGLLLPTRYAFELVRPYIPIHLTPAHLCGSYFGKVSACCGNNLHNQISSCSVCETSPGHKHVNGEPGISASTINSTNQTATSHYSLKEICEELLVQLSRKERPVLHHKACVNDNFSVKSTSTAETQTATSSVTFNNISNSLKLSNLKCDPKIQNGDELATSSSVALNSLAEAIITMQCQSTVPSVNCLLTSEETPQTVPSPVLSDHPITPDLLRDSDNAHCRRLNDTPDSALLAKKEKMRLSLFEDVPTKLNSEGTPNPQLEQHQSEQTIGVSEIIHGAKGSDDIEGNLVTDIISSTTSTQSKVVSHSRVEPGGQDEVTSNEGLSPVLDNFSPSEQNAKTEQPGKSTDCATENPKQGANKTADSIPINGSEEMKNGGDISVFSAQQTLTKKSDITSVIGCVKNPTTLPVDSNQDVTMEPVVPNSIKKQGSKVLSRIHNLDFSNVTKSELQNSPAFEELDPSEMETVLLIWRQQEQLHKDQGKPESSAPSSPGNVFRKVNKLQELPPELRSTRQSPPSSVKEKNSTASSALDILDVEAKKALSGEDDDDISECSPHCEISPPKRRRLKLRLNPPVPLVIQKTKENLIREGASHPISTSTPNGIPVIKKASSGLRSSKRLKAAASQNSNELSVDQTISGLAGLAMPKQELKDSKAKVLLNKKCNKTKNKQADESADSTTTISSSKETIVKKNNKEIMAKIKEDDITSNDKAISVKDGEDKSKTEPEEAICNSTVLITKEVNTKKNQKKMMDKMKQSDVCPTTKATAVNEGEDKNNFHDQIQERVNKLKRKWLKEKSDDEIDVVDINSSPSDAASNTPPVSQITEDGQDVLVSEGKSEIIRSVPIIELGKAHDLATHILLNPWRGINARRVTRGFVCPTYESKIVTRALWDLRSNADISNVVERILGLGWKGFHPRAVRALVAMFTLSFSRRVPFVIDGMKGEEDDAGSLSSDAEHSKKKSMPVRLVATKQIFKGECIEGLNGLLLKTSDKEKETLRSWNFPKLKGRRDWVLFGPLAYLKRDESDYNTQAVFLKDELIAVKATRLVLSGEVLLVSFKEVERKFCM